VDSEYGQIEHQANTFAANLLMPLDDFRRQISATAKVHLDMIYHCADRYCVSLMSAILRWLSYTEKRAVLVMSRDGFILWARSSARALKSGAFFRTSAGPIEIPSASLAANLNLLLDGHASIDHAAGIWFREPVREMTIYAEQHDFALSLLLLDDSASYTLFEDAAEPGKYDKMMPELRRRVWYW
jgi:IrrE N-terminal-like domain